MRRRGILAAVAAALVASVLLLAGARAPESPGIAFWPRLQSARTLIGHPVVNPDGKQLGEVRDIVLAANGRDLSYAVVDFGGLLGIDATWVAVPWTALRMRSDGKAFVLDVPKETFQNVEGFTEDAWPDRGDPRWLPGGAGATGAQRKDLTLAQIANRRLSQILDREVLASGNESVGEVVDVVIDTDGGAAHALFASVATAFSEEFPSRLVTVPWAAIEWRQGKDTGTLDAQAASVRKLSFPLDEYPPHILNVPAGRPPKRVRTR